ncbi:MAG: rRNA maturation RNase YbeY [Alphaproteobacteria bacterium]|nr:rRNA maturation RNase YbeY [Alphaproteobacteria bacterium]
MVMNKHLLNLITDDSQWADKLPNVESLSNKVFNQTINHLEKEQLSPLPSSQYFLQVNLSLSNNNTVHKLNKEFRNIDKPTNVLSFANIDDPDFETYIQTEQSIELGDIIIAIETLEQEALSKNIPLQNHFCHLFTHGILHLLGFDHQDDLEAEEMETLEIQIMQQLNIPNPYEE